MISKIETIVDGLIHIDQDGFLLKLTSAFDIGRQ